MTIFAYVFGTAGILFGILSYWHFRRWVNACRYTRIAVAHNRRVQINATLDEMLGWANTLKKTGAKGQVFYRNNHVSVSVLRPDKAREPKTTVKTVKQPRRKKVTA